MSKTAIGMVLLLFWAAVLIFVVALVWRRFAKLGGDSDDVAAQLRRYDDENAPKDDAPR